MSTLKCTDADFADAWRSATTIAGVLEALSKIGAHYTEGTARRRAKRLGLVSKPSAAQCNYLGSKEQFIQAWTSSATVEEVAAKLREAGLRYKVDSLKTRARVLRTYGYALQYLPNGDEAPPPPLGRVSDDQFVALWNAAPDLASARAAIEQAAGRTYAWNRVSERAWKLRKKGFQVKRFHYHGDKTHCPKGHEYSDSSVVNKGGGVYGRTCLVCRREAERSKRLPKRVLALSAKLQALLEAQSSVGVCSSSGDRQGSST